MALDTINRLIENILFKLFIFAFDVSYPILSMQCITCCLTSSKMLMLCMRFQGCEIEANGAQSIKSTIYLVSR